MIRVLIVEDERPIARAISHLVDQHPAFGVIGIETNGQAALDFLRANRVDLVITDIQMPVMTGLQLLEAIYHEIPKCLTVVLSGYAQFDYARTALQFRAFDYLLKSVTRENLFRVLDRVRQEWDSRNQTQLRSLMDRALSGETVSDDHVFRVILIHSFGSIPRPDCPHHLFRRERECILLVEAGYWTQNLADSFYRQCCRDMAEPLHMVCSETEIRLNSLNATLQQLRRIIEQQARLFCSDLFHADKPVVRSSSPLQRLKPERAAEAIRAQNRKDLLAQLNTMLTATTLCADAQSYLDAVLSDSRITLQHAADKRNEVRAAVSELLFRATDRDSCAEALAEALSVLQGETAAKRDLSEIVDEIAHLLETNYHLHHSAESLAKQYNFVPAYLNKVFKQFKGVRPSEYLFNVRMERARIMLETTPDVLVKDVAASVGYNDSHYFSNLFKKATGLWPTEVQQTTKES